MLSRFEEMNSRLRIISNLYQVLLCIPLIGMWLLLLVVPTSLADDMITVTVQGNQSLRDIAEEYLGNPNLWIDILRVNDLESPTDIRPGMRLKVPAGVVAEANKLLAKSLKTIDDAIMNGDAFSRRMRWSELILFERKRCRRANEGTGRVARFMLNRLKPKPAKRLRFVRKTKMYPLRLQFTTVKGVYNHARLNPGSGVTVRFIIFFLKVIMFGRSRNHTPGFVFVMKAACVLRKTPSR